MKSPAYRILLSALMALSVFAACGYRMSGTGAIVPHEARSLAVLTFLNGTREPYVDIEVTRAVVNEFLADGRLKITDADTADLLLRGRVVQYLATALSYTADSYVQQYQVRLIVEASLAERRSGRVLWQEKGIESSFIADYPVEYAAPSVVDIMATKTGKEITVRKASQDIAWTIRSRVLEGF